jgi:hypothetical protein
VTEVREIAQRARSRPVDVAEMSAWGDPVHDDRQERNRECPSTASIARRGPNRPKAFWVQERIPSNRGDAQRGPGHVGQVHVRCKPDAYGEREGFGVLTQALTRRQRTSESATLGSAPSAERRRGSSATETVA